MNSTLKLGEHFIFDLSNCNHETLMDSERAYSLFAQAVRESGLTKNPAYCYANIPTYPGGGVGFMYVSDTPWEKGLKTPYPPGVNNYINPEIHQAAFALPESFRKELYNRSD